MVTVAEMVAAARENVRDVTKSEVEDALHDEQTLMIDIRDIRERTREGTIPGARHVPRGMLEFWADPTCEYHKEFMRPEAPVILYCAGGQRSALAAQTLQQLGYTAVAHLGIGFNGWREQGGATERVQQRS